MNSKLPVAITDISLPLPLLRKGKVRHVYDLGDTLLIVATDRVSAFDYILPTGIPEKGQILTRVSQFWFDRIAPFYQHHLMSTSVLDLPSSLAPYHSVLEGRMMIVQKTQVVPIECVVRGYIIGTGWKDYQRTGAICGHELPKGLQLAEALPSPIFTPATKAETGHDENITFAEMEASIGSSLAHTLKEESLAIYEMGSKYARERGIILADTKFEFGIVNGTVLLIDEVLTPDSSRYWPIASYVPGQSPPSFDKQIVRDYLEQSGWDKHPPVPSLPLDIVEKVHARYLDLEHSLVD